MKCRALNCITLHYITLHYITLHYITLHYITLHYITLHYITLHDSAVRCVRVKKHSSLSISLYATAAVEMNRTNQILQKFQIQNSKSIKYGYDKRVSVPKKVTAPKAINGVF